MYTNPFTSYPIIKPHFNKARLFSQNCRFSNISPKQGFKHEQHSHEIPTYHLTSMKIIHGIFVSQSFFVSQNFTSSSHF